MGSQEKSFKLHIYDIDEKWSFSYKSCFFYHSYILSLQNNTPEYSTIEKTNDSLNGGQVLVNFGGDCSNSQENSPSDSKHNLYDDENGVYNSLFEIQENTVKNCDHLYNHMCEFDFAYNDFHFPEECTREMENAEYSCIEIERG